MVLLLAFTFTACGGGDTTDGTTEAKQEKLNQLKAQLLTIQEEIKALESDLRSASGAPVGKSARSKQDR